MADESGHTMDQAPKSQWVIWYEEEMAILGEDATTERKLAAIEKAQKRQQEWEAAKNRASALWTASTIREAPRVSRKDFKPFQEDTGDVEGFFQDFEHQCELLGVPDTERTRHVVGLLDGGAAEAYRMLDPPRKGSYEDIKRAVLDYYAVSPEAYRLQFRSAHRPLENSFKMFAHKLSVACHRWLEGENASSPEEIVQVILKEQFFSKCPAEIRQWVRERKPATLREAAVLADEATLINPQWKRASTEAPCPTSAPVAASAPYRPPQRRMGPGRTPPLRPMLSHSGNPMPRVSRPIAERSCFGCGQIGHYQASCPERKSTPGPSHSMPVHYVGSYQAPEDLPPKPQPSRSPFDHQSYRCVESHHLQARRPRNSYPPQDQTPHLVHNGDRPQRIASLAPPKNEYVAPTATNTPCGVYGVYPHTPSYPELRQQHLQEVSLDGRKVTGFRDTGAFLTIVEPRVVSPDAIQKGPGLSIELAGGERKRIPRALVHLDYGFGEKLCSVGVMTGLPADILLGNDLGELDSYFVGTVTPSQSQGVEEMTGTQSMQQEYPSRIYPINCVRPHVAPAKSSACRKVPFGSLNKGRHTGRAPQPRCYSCRQRGHMQANCPRRGRQMSNSITSLWWRDNVSGLNFPPSGPNVSISPPPHPNVRPGWDKH